MSPVKLALKIYKTHPEYSDQASPWESALPFVENNRAKLIHRPRSVTRYTIHKYPHLGVGYWCGLHASGDGKFTFLSAPAKDALLCARCEKKAVEAGLPSADALTGRHVHLGVCVPVKTCCGEKK